MCTSLEVSLHLSAGCFAAPWAAGAYSSPWPQSGCTVAWVTHLPIVGVVGNLTCLLFFSRIHCCGCRSGLSMQGVVYVMCSLWQVHSCQVLQHTALHPYCPARAAWLGRFLHLQRLSHCRCPLLGSGSVVHRVCAALSIEVCIAPVLLGLVIVCGLSGPQLWSCHACSMQTGPVSTA